MKFNSFNSLLRLVFVLKITLFSIQTSFAQYHVEWSAVFGGGFPDKANGGLVLPSDSGFLLVGSSVSPTQKIWVVRTDKFGKGKWGRTYGERNMLLEAKAVAFDSDSGFVVAGSAVLNRAIDADMYVTKLDRNGNEMWSKYYGDRMQEEAYAIVVEPDGYVMAGYQMSTIDYEPDAMLMKLDRDGFKVWAKTFGDVKADYCYSLAKTFDGGYVLAGTKGNARGNKGKMFWVIKTDSNGETIWEQTYGESKWNSANSIIQTSDSCFVAVGFMKADDFESADIYCVKMDAYGMVIWSTVIGSSTWDEATDVVETFDKGYAVAAYTKSNDESLSDFRTLKLDIDGKLIWEHTFHRKSLDYPKEILETYDNGLALIGATFSEKTVGWDFAVLKYENNLRPVVDVVNPYNKFSAFEEKNYPIAFTVLSKSDLKEYKVLVNDRTVFKEKFEVD